MTGPDVWYLCSMSDRPGAQKDRTARRIAKAEAREFRRRWHLVNAAEREELRTTPLTRKLRQTAALMASIGQLGWTEQLASEEAEVRERWNRLRRVGHA